MDQTVQGSSQWPEPLQQGPVRDQPRAGSVTTLAGYKASPAPGLPGQALEPLCRFRGQGLRGGGLSHTGAHGPLTALLLELLGSAPPHTVSLTCPLVFQGPKGKQGKAGTPGRRGIQVSDPQLCLSYPPPCPPQKPSPASRVPTGSAGPARAPGRGGETGPRRCCWTRWASWQGRSTRAAGEQDLGISI